MKVYRLENVKEIGICSHSCRLLRTALTLALKAKGEFGPLDAHNQHVTCSRFLYIYIYIYIYIY